jgi:hypothetical protein
MTPVCTAQETIGYVLALRGHWRVEGNPGRPLAKGAAVRAGEVVRVESPSDVNDYVLIAGSGVHAPAVRLRCSDPGGCDRPLSLAALTPQAAEHGSRILDAIMSFWHEAEPEIYAVLGSRGGGARLREAVVEIAAGKADLRPVLSGLAPGRYRVRLQPVHEKDREGFGVAEEEIRIEPDGTQPVWMSGLPAGLCAIEASALDRADGGPGETAWVLLAPKASYQGLSQQFGEVLALTQGWGDEVDANVVREILRAALDHLSVSAVGGKVHG